MGGEKVPARTPGEGKLKAIEDAPGSYAKLRLDQQSGEAEQAEAPASTLEKIEKPPVAQTVQSDAPSAVPADPPRSKKPHKSKRPSR